MANQIVKQPNGLYAIWSSVVDSFTSVDNTPAEIIDEWTAKERERLQNSVNDIIAKLDKGERPYHQFTMSFDECMSAISGLHGKDEASEILRLME